MFIEAGFVFDIKQFSWVNSKQAAFTVFQYLANAAAASNLSAAEKFNKPTAGFFSWTW